MSATPFFSPDHSIGTITNLIERAEETLDIGTPGFSSWSGCTDFDGSGDDDASQCVGCSIYAMRQEQFPVFPAIVNALHRGVTVRLLTNNYNTPTCSGKVRCDGRRGGWGAGVAMQTTMPTSHATTHPLYRLRHWTF